MYETWRSTLSAVQVWNATSATNSGLTQCTLASSNGRPKCVVLGGFSALGSTGREWDQTTRLQATDPVILEENKTRTYLPENRDDAAGGGDVFMCSSRILPPTPEVEMFFSFPEDGLSGNLWARPKRQAPDEGGRARRGPHRSQHRFGTVGDD